MVKRGIAARPATEPTDVGTPINVYDAKYNLRLSPSLDKSLTALASAMKDRNGRTGNKGHVIAHALTVLAVCAHHIQQGGTVELRMGAQTVRTLDMNVDGTLPGDLDILPDEVSEE